uniref:Transmembrane protein n=1 Tax=Pithovirus LCDPAC01 TaxID=2506600 RepID=A0A481YPK4_9VIRU|nr:MAG: hypothetical protein LCDPAC01_02030 [Pithovirus LCDPAC01]
MFKGCIISKLEKKLAVHGKSKGSVGFELLEDIGFMINRKIRTKFMIIVFCMALILTCWKLYSLTS